MTPDYFPAMGIPLRAGRFLTEADTSDELLFAVVNETTAKALLARSKPDWRFRSAQPT